ncbi:uncharacterized protein ARMOST_16771 [Armillaria ostoyae]|uniref:Uncharacterized protein n=1 Tax=Armillaria ostoyae TaxID=47428 RepID=A0A284RX45_ARMOS|nr:uncharacterized protein ARMOST_16771 [Armillaria ostoyae]
MLRRNVDRSLEAMVAVEEEPCILLVVISENVWIEIPQIFTKITPPKIKPPKIEPPKITLSALTETDKAKSTIPVLKQRSYTGQGVIRSSLANTPCADLSVGGVLKELNTTLGTSYTSRSRSVVSILEPYVAQNYDFGTVYAYLRPCWNYYV